MEDEEKKYSLDSDEEDAVREERKLRVDDIDGQENTTMVQHPIQLLSCCYLLII